MRYYIHPFIEYRYSTSTFFCQVCQVSGDISERPRALRLTTNYIVLEGGDKTLKFVV